MAIAKVQGPFYNSGTTPLTKSFTNNPTTGNLMIAFAKGSTAATNASIPNWTLATSTLCTSSGWSALFYKVVGAGESKDVVLTWTSSAGTYIIIEEWSGLSATPLDQIADTDNTGSTVESRSSGTTSATTVADELCIAGFAMGNPVTSQSWSNSFTEEYGGPPTTLLIFLGSLIVTSTGTQTTTLSWTTARLTGGLIATFKGAATTWIPKIIMVD